MSFPEIPDSRRSSWREIRPSKHGLPGLLEPLEDAVGSINTCLLKPGNRQMRDLEERFQRVLGTAYSRRAVARRTVPMPMPSSAAIAFQPRPAVLSSAIRSLSTVTCGLPSCLPLAFAAAIPDRTRSRINFPFELCKMPKMSRPFGVEVSTPSCRLTTSILSERNSSSALTSCRTLRAKRS